MAIEDSTRGLDEYESEEEIMVQKKAITYFHRYMFISELLEDLKAEVLSKHRRVLGFGSD